MIKKVVLFSVSLLIFSNYGKNVESTEFDSAITRLASAVTKSPTDIQKQLKLYLEDYKTNKANKALTMTRLYALLTMAHNTKDERTVQAVKEALLEIGSAGETVYETKGLVNNYEEKVAAYMEAYNNHSATKAVTMAKLFDLLNELQHNQDAVTMIREQLTQLGAGEQ